MQIRRPVSPEILKLLWRTVLVQVLYALGHIDTPQDLNNPQKATRCTSRSLARLSEFLDHVSRAAATTPLATVLVGGARKPVLALTLGVIIDEDAPTDTSLYPVYVQRATMAILAPLAALSAAGGASAALGVSVWGGCVPSEHSCTSAHITLHSVGVESVCAPPHPLLPRARVPCLVRTAPKTTIRRPISIQNYDDEVF